MRLLRLFLVCLLLGSLFRGSLLKAQDFRSPLDIPLLMSANFGELRPNHFHAGLDLKTQGVEGKPIYAVEDGYVSRISVSPWGYGNGLYLTHPNGTTTLYGHLKRFSSKIARFLIAEQYKQERFRVDLHLTPEQLPVKKGEIVAYSGNTGSSGGPHLHFEIRDTETEQLMDPIVFYQNKIKDTRPPKIHGVMICPFEGRGVVNNSTAKLKLKPVTGKNGKSVLTGKIEAWGEIGLAINANDYMDNTTNIYGVKDVRLSMDSLDVFHFHIDRYGFDETRYINALIDYAELKKHGTLYMRNFIEPGNRLNCVEGRNEGVISIDEEKTYHLRYLLTDAYGNQTRLSVFIEGKRQDIPEATRDTSAFFSWNSENKFGSKGIRLTVPRGSLYNDLAFRYDIKTDSSAIAPVHYLHDELVPLHSGADLSLRLAVDTLQDKGKYGIVCVKNGYSQWVGGTYRNGWIDGHISGMGAYSIRTDTSKPTITPLQTSSWPKNGVFRFRLTDNLSGVESYRGEIDGKFVLFEMNSRSVISYRLDRKIYQKGKPHTLKIKVVDAAGNRNEYTYNITW